MCDILTYFGELWKPYIMHMPFDFIITTTTCPFAWFQKCHRVEMCNQMFGWKGKLLTVKLPMSYTNCFTTADISQ